MDDFCSKANKMLKEEKFNDFINHVKSKFKQLTLDEIDYLYNVSISKNIMPLTLMVLNLRWKNIKKVPDMQLDRWLSLTQDFLIGVSSEVNPTFIKYLFRLSLKFGELSFEIGNSMPDYSRKAQFTLLKVLEKSHKVSEITPIHYLVAKLGLFNKKLYELERIMKCNFLQVCTNSKVTGVQCVLFFYYIGSVALILKNYSRVNYFYELAICMPSKSIHIASIESYKKQVLIQLITDGSQYHVPRLAPSRFSSIVRHHSCEHYSKLASLFTEYIRGKGDKESVLSYINKAKNFWAMDKNEGLIKKVKTALIKHKVKKLTKVYASLTFKQLKKETEEEKADDIVTKMIENREITGKIDRKNETVIFYDVENQVTIDEIEDVCEDLMKYTEQVEVRLREVNLDTRYLKQLLFTEGLNKDR